MSNHSIPAVTAMQTRRMLMFLLSGTISSLTAQGPGGGAQKPLPLEGSRKAAFTTTRGTWMSLDVSPDGRTIVFDLLGDLYTVPIDGGKATALTTGMAYDAQPRFSPDGKKIAFVSDRSGADNVWIIAADRSDTTQLTRGTGGQFVSPAWTPDGKYIVVSGSAGGFGMPKLQLYHIDGGGGLPLIQPTPETATLKTLGAAVSRDGRYVWFASRRYDWNYNALFPQFQLGYYDRESGESTQLTSRYGSAFRPALSPDGKWVTYGSRQGANTGLRIRNLQTGDEEWLAYPIQGDGIESRATLDALPGYAFTPDSRALVLSYGGEIWRVPIDKSPPTKIPFSADVRLDVGPEVHFVNRVDTSALLTVRQIRGPAVSPDGKRVAFTAVDRLYVADLPNGEPRRVTDAAVGEYEPVWSPDGRSLAWITWGDAAGGRIMKIAVGGRGARPVQLTRTAALYTNPAWNPDGSRIVATRQAALDLVEASGNGGGSAGGDFVWVPSAGGDATTIAPTAGRDVAHFVTAEPDRIYASSFAEGLVSFRWDGTDVKQHVRVSGPMPFGSGGLDPGGDEAVMPRRITPLRSADLASTGSPRPGEPSGGPTPAGVILMSPNGGEALAQVNTDVYTLTVPKTGGPVPTINVAMGGAVPTRKVSDVGGEFPSWSADGRTVHYALGNALFSYDLTRAGIVDDSLKALERARADSAAKSQARADSLKTLRTRADSLAKAGAAVPDSIQSRIDGLRPRVDADSIRKMEAARIDSIKKAAKAPGKAQDEKAGYQPDELRIKVTIPRDRPRGDLVLRGGRVITMKGKEVIENADVVIKDNRIAGVGVRGSIPIPGRAKVIDVTGKTIVPGMVDVHYHAFGLVPEIHPSQAWPYLTTLAYGVTTTRDPQTGSTDVLSYQDRVDAGTMIGPRIYSTGPGVGIPDNEVIASLEDARRVLKRYSEYWDTKTLKMYMSGNRQRRQWIIMAAKELGLMPTTEGGIDFRLDLTHVIDGYPGVEHALPVAPLFEDVIELFKASKTTNTPTLLVSYGGPFGENYFFTHEDVVGDKKLATFMPKGQIDAKARRRGDLGYPYPTGGWFYRDEYIFPRHAESMKRMVEAGARVGIGSHGQLQGLGHHWEVWAMASGGMTNLDVLRVATLNGAEALGMEQDIGSLEPGKLADLQVLDKNPLDDIRNTNTIKYVMKNGRLYDANTLSEVFPRTAPLPKQWWAEGPPATAAGIH